MTLRVCLAGPMLGGSAGWVTTQGEILGRLLAADGHSVLLTSSTKHPVTRVADTVACVTRWRRRIDVLVVMVFSGRAFAVADVTTALARRFGLPTILVLRGGNLPEFAARHRRWVDRVLGRATTIVAPSPFLERSFTTLGYDVTVVPNVIPLEDYVWRERDSVRPRLLWMRTFHPLYRPDLAVEAVRHLVAEGHDVYLTMAGQEKGMLDEVKRLVGGYGLQSRVRFAGFLDMAAKQREFAAHDLFLNTNQVDNMPVSVVEACAFGLPVVATDVGGVRDLLTHEETGLLVDDGDAPAIAQAVGRLLTDPHLAGRLSRQGRRLAERSSWDAVSPLWEQLLAAAAS